VVIVSAAKFRNTEKSEATVFFDMSGAIFRIEIFGFSLSELQVVIINMTNI